MSRAGGAGGRRKRAARAGGARECRIINGQYRMMARRRKLGILFREHFEQYFYGVLAPLDDLKRAIHDHESKRRWALNQYCTCCDCVRGLVEKRMKFAYIS